MAFRYFNDIKYPVPGVDTALEILRPGCKWSLHNTHFDGWLDDTGEGREPPTWEEIQEEIKIETDINLAELNISRPAIVIKDPRVALLAFSNP